MTHKQLDKTVALYNIHMEKKPQICDFMQNKEKNSVICRKPFAVLIYSNSIRNYFYAIWNITLLLIFKREKVYKSSHCPHYYSLHHSRGKKKIKEAGAKTNCNSLKQQFWKGASAPRGRPEPGCPAPPSSHTILCLRLKMTFSWVVTAAPRHTVENAVAWYFELQ